MKTYCALNKPPFLSKNLQPKAAGEETAPVIIGVVPNNAPVILPNGESALSEVQPAVNIKRPLKKKKRVEK